MDLTDETWGFNPPKKNHGFGSPWTPPDDTIPAEDLDTEEEERRFPHGQSVPRRRQRSAQQFHCFNRR